MEISTRPYALDVDDGAIILMDGCEILTNAGFEAVGVLRRHAENVTLPFSDVEMPDDTDGFVLARYVDEHWPWIEIVAASGRIKPSAW